MTEFELLEELAKELSLPDIEDDEVTAQLVADYTGVSWSTASRVLKDKLAAGELTERQVRNKNGRIATAYRKV
jgi:Fic family protein